MIEHEHQRERQHLSIGIGCSSRASSDNIIRLIERCVPQIFPCSVLATIDRRISIVEGVASVLGIRLMLFPASVLAQVEGTTVQSALALARTRTSSVAEASALAALGPSARLILPRQTGHLCTCAVAALPITVPS